MAANYSRTALILFAHGSRVEEANRGVCELARQVQTMGPYAYVRAAFLEQAPPDLPQAVAAAFQAGQQRVIVIPYFLTMGIHLQRDIPKLVEAEKAKYPDMVIEIGRSLEGDPLMASIILDRVRETTEKIHSEE